MSLPIKLLDVIIQSFYFLLRYKHLHGAFGSSWSKYSILPLKEKIGKSEDWHVQKFRLVHIHYFTHCFPDTGFLQNLNLLDF